MAILLTIFQVARKDRSKNRLHNLLPFLGGIATNKMKGLRKVIARKFSLIASFQKSAFDLFQLFIVRKYFISRKFVRNKAKIPLLLCTQAPWTGRDWSYVLLPCFISFCYTHVLFTYEKRLISWTSNVK